jgi:glutamate--cysteine ligase
MSLDRAPTEDEAVTSIDALIEGFRTAERPRAEHGVGLEHEKFLAGPAGGARIHTVS